MPTSGIYTRVSRTTILFVDDDADTRFAYQAVTSAEGFGVELASGGHEAIALANVLLPDIIVLDARLPDLGGLEVARRLRGNPRTRSIPIIMASGEDSERFQAAVRDVGCEGHVTKPCSLDDLLGLVRALTKPRRALVPYVGGGAR